MTIREPTASDDGLRDRAQPLRVLYVTHSFSPIGRPLDNLGGMQRTAEDLHAALCRCPGLEVHTQGLRTTARLANVRTPGYVTWLARTLPDTIRARHVDVVLFTSLVTAAAAVPISRMLRGLDVRLASIVHGRVVTRRSGVLRWMLPRVFDALDAVYPVSSGTAAACRARGVAPDKVTVIPNGVNLARFREPDDRPAARSELLEATRSLRNGMSEPELVVCGVGRHVLRKGFGWFAREVMPRLPDGVQFWLAGDGPETPTIRREIRRNGLAGRVLLLGPVPEQTLALLYRGADVFVMPNVTVPGDFEGFGVVMLEAGASGMPVVASRIEGITDVVREDATGRLVASGDAEGFAEAIAAHAADRDALAAAGRRAAAAVRAEFDWTVVAGRYAGALRGLVGARPASRGAA